MRHAIYHSTFCTRRRTRDLLYEQLSQHQAFISKYGRSGGLEPQHSVLETDALPIELLTYSKLRAKALNLRRNSSLYYAYAVTLATTPAPTVRPPSRIAKRRPGSIAIGWINSTDISTLSPGITISTPSFNWIAPVTSVVRK